MYYTCNFDLLLLLITFRFRLEVRKLFAFAYKSPVDIQADLTKKNW